MSSRLTRWSVCGPGNATASENEPSGDDESNSLRTLGAHTRELRTVETYTLIVDGLGIGLFGALIYLDGRRARGRRPSG
jgi:hypothetical protein